MRTVALLLAGLAALAPLAAAGSAWGELSFFTPVPCWYACPGLTCELGACPAPAPILTYEPACAPVPAAVPGNYDDEFVVVGPTASRLHVHLDAPPPLADFQLFGCRATPDADGNAYLDMRYSGVCGSSGPRDGQVCEPLGGGQFADLVLDVSALRGETLRLRVYNAALAIEPAGWWEQTSLS